MSEYETLTLDVNQSGIARLTLNRPDARNAMSQQMIRDLTAVRSQLDDDPQVRVVVLSGAGKVFCAGGDLRGFQQQAASTREGRIHDATEFAKTLAALNDLSKPVVGRINGSAYGGGLGLMSICDLCIGVSTAKFRLTEVTLGLIPATISPHVVARIGVPNARRTMLNAHEIDAAEAVRIGLLQSAVEADELDAAVDREIDKFLKCAPGAVSNCKRLIRYVSTHGIEENIDYTAQALAEAWESAEIKEGVEAFLNKRKPNWDLSDAQ